MFDNLDHAKATALTLAHGKCGRLRLAASEDVMTGTLARITAGYREQWPEVHLDLLELPAIAQVRVLQRGRPRRLDLCDVAALPRGYCRSLW
jgi:DNA-binding transcriptional LysR family regulator